ncbi:hypothetical protein [Planococcus sp. ISL-109]|uniref:hypothetical protein n=1 Tax=Planococcus sp. ISL-109 TaxID=2819166 RepID=UPI001BEC03FD|nr:hypothetical protein [Planococcus sp. ISL-109]MBT2581332.1 hypothetical protein [Planococcus sp. ISL-109]
MIWVLSLSLITILSVIAGLRKRKPLYFLVPVASLFTFMLVKVIMVPLPFVDTVRFIFQLRG